MLRIPRACPPCPPRPSRGVGQIVSQSVFEAVSRQGQFCPVGYEYSYDRTGKAVCCKTTAGGTRTCQPASSQGRPWRAVDELTEGFAFRPSTVASDRKFPPAADCPAGYTKSSGGDFVLCCKWDAPKAEWDCKFPGEPITL